MAKALDATCYGSPSDCFYVGEVWLKSTLHDAHHTAWVDAFNARRASYDGWIGPAGDAFRQALTPVIYLVDEAAATAKKLGTALVTFSEDLEKVHNQIGTACSDATAAGLKTDVTQDPQGALRGRIHYPTLEGFSLPRFQRDVQYANEIEAKAKRLKEAWEKAVKDIKAARLAEEAAHRKLRDEINEGLKATEETKAKVDKYVGRALSIGALPGDTLRYYRDLVLSAQEVSGTSKILEKLGLGKELTKNEQLTAAAWVQYRDAMTEASAADGRLAAINEFASKIESNTPPAKLARWMSDLNMSVGEFLERTGAEPTGGKHSSRGRHKGSGRLAQFVVKNPTALKALKHVPLVGTVYTTGSGAYDVVVKGENPAEVVANQAAGVGAGVVVGTALKLIKVGPPWLSVPISLVTTEYVGGKVKNLIDDQFLDDEFAQHVYYTD